MRRLAAALLLLAGGEVRASGQPLVRVAIEAKQPVLVGQQLRVDVQVLAPNFFLSPPQFPGLEIPGAVVELLDEHALNSTESIDGVSYAAIQKTYAVTPQQPGEFRLPPAKIAFEYAAEPGKPGVAGSVTLPPQTFAARLPEGAEPSRAPAPVSKVVLTQTLDRELAGLKVGDTLTRTIEAFAADTQPMAIPPPSFEAPAGVRVYRHDPVLADVKGDRGQLVGGRRVDRVTYAFEEPGSYVLPAVEVGWLDAANGRREVSRAPEIRVSVEARPGFSSALAPPAPAAPSAAGGRIGGRAWLAMGVALALGRLGVWLVRRYGPRLRGWSEARRRMRADSEPAFFAEVVRACAADDGAAAYRALEAWVRRTGAPSLAALAAGDPALRAQVTALEERLYGAHPASGAWDGRALAAAASSVRERRRADDRRAATGRAGLPALNP